MTESFPQRLLLVDGHYYLYRSFFAIRGLSNSRGEPTNAIYGFVKALRRMLADVKPDLAAVIWDAGLPERRTQLQPQYKQHRDEMPVDLDVQQEPIQEIVPLLGVASLFLENTEADDLIASYVIEARKQEIECVVATNDKDILQLVREGVSIYSTVKADVGEGNGGFKLLGVPEVRAKWGVEPELIADVLALTGDSADNIPGVPGVGGKTAAKWINQYGSLDHLLKSDDLDPKVREKVEASRELIVANRQMVALDLDLPLPMPIPEMRVAPRYVELIESLRRCEFRSLTAEVEREAERLGARILEMEYGGSTGKGVEGPRTRDKSQKQHLEESGVESPAEREGSSVTESLSDHLLPILHTPTQGELF
jgi:DNA polymerase-1